jgi:hypothetical protein
VTFPWIHDSELQAARAEARLEAEGAFTEAAQEHPRVQTQARRRPGLAPLLGPARAAGKNPIRTA